MTKGKDVCEYFSAVVRNLGNSNFQIRRLIYIFVVHYAQREPELTLLSINSFQKDLSDSHYMVRATAVRALSSIALPSLAAIVAMALNTASKDMNPFVRKTAALALIQLVRLDVSTREQAIETLDSVMGDKSPFVLGAAAMAFQEICPSNSHLLHRHYRHLCRCLADVDEWGQVSLLRLLLRYALTYIDTRRLEDEQNGDLHLLINACCPLLWSRNDAVVLAVANVYKRLGCMSDKHLLVQPLIKIIHTRPDISAIALRAILSLTDTDNQLFSENITSFFVRSIDSQSIGRLKLAILAALTNEHNVSTIFHELQGYIHGDIEWLMTASVKTLGIIAQRTPSHSELCLQVLIRLLTHPNDGVVTESILVLRLLLQNFTAATSTSKPEHSHQTLREYSIKTVLRSYSTLHSGVARAMLLNLLSKSIHLDLLRSLAPDILRIALQSFAQETAAVKLEILGLAALLFLDTVTRSEATILTTEINAIISQLVDYAFQLCRFDQSFDVRDKARLLKGLLNAKSIPRGVIYRMLCPPPGTTVIPPLVNITNFALDSLSQFVGIRCPGYQDLDLVEYQTIDSSIRDTPGDISPTSLDTTAVSLFPSNSTDSNINIQNDSASTQKRQSQPAKKWQSLDDFYNDSTSSEEEDEVGDSDVDQAENILNDIEESDQYDNQKTIDIENDSSSPFASDESDNESILLKAADDDILSNEDESDSEGSPSILQQVNTKHDKVRHGTDKIIAEKAFAETASLDNRNVWQDG